MSQPTPFPTIDDLNAMPPEACSSALSPLVEGAPRFLAHLVAARPFTSDAALLDAMHEVASAISEEEQVELLQAHPRIGAAGAELSALSRDEQAADQGEETTYVAEELANLNDLYERRFGFRYVVFVAGRPREAIIPLMEQALRNEREAELRRAVHDAIYVAGDRLNRLRGPEMDDEEEQPE